MAQPVQKRWYPTHEANKPVDPRKLNEHLRLHQDLITDIQTALGNMTGGATALALFAAGAITSIQVMYPGFGYGSPPAITITGGGGSGAKAVATIKNGRVASIQVTAGGAGYTSTPVVTFSS